MSKKNKEKLEEMQETVENKVNTESQSASVAEGSEVQDNQPEETTPEQQIAQLEEQVAEYKDKYLRQLADFDNYKKRALRERAEIILHGGEKVISALLPVLDDFERAADSMAKATDVDALREGVELIKSKFVSILESNGLKRIDAVGQDFNTDFHEAIAMVPVEDIAQKGKVIDCVQAGYTLNEKVIRHSKVAIGQ